MNMQGSGSGLRQLWYNKKSWVKSKNKALGVTGAAGFESIVSALEENLKEADKPVFKEGKSYAIQLYRLASEVMCLEFEAKGEFVED